MAIELKVPAIGESITEVEIGDWLVKEGAQVQEDDPLVVIESDKASMELPAPKAGTLTKILKQTGDTASVNEVIGTLEAGEAPEKAESQASDTEPSQGGTSQQAASQQAPLQEAASPEDTPVDGTPTNVRSGGDTRVMPAARRALEQAGLETSQVKATGPGGRLLKEDVERHQEQPSAPAPSPKSVSAAKAAPAGAREEEVVRMTSLRRRIAERLVGAQQQAALLTTFNEVDMSGVMALRAQHKESFTKRYGIKLGFMSFFVKAVIEGLKEVPALNAEIRDENIVYRNYFDIGVAVGGGRGLVVPVIRNAERLSFAEIELTIADLAGRAQKNTLTIEELQGGTFTISNGGIYGSMLSTPIVNPPQSGILGMHNIVQRPVAVQGEVVIRPIMYVALTYDHRVVDGREAVTFLVRVKDCIEQPARMLLEI